MDKKTAILLLVVFIDLIGFGVVIPILPLLIKKIGGDVLLVGLTISIFSLFQFVFAPILGRLSDKYGRRPILILSSFINAFSYFLIFISQGIWVIILARIVAGIGSANISVAQAYIADTSTSHDRTKKMALIGAAFGLGFMVGPVFGGFISQQFGINIAFLLTAIFSAINTILIFLFLPESNKILQKDLKVKIQLFNLKVTREVLRPKNMSFLLFLFFFVNLALALIMGVFPLFTQYRFGWDGAQNGYYFGLIGTGSFITQAFLVNRMLKFIDETQMIRLALLIFGLAIIAIGVAPAGWILYALAPFTSFGFSLINVSVQSLISLESKPEEQGIVLGTSQSFGSMARAIGPLVGGGIATLSMGLPYIVSGLMAIGILFWGQGYLKYMKSTKAAKKDSAF